MSGEDIKKRRKELGWKQSDLAQRMGTSVNTVSTWERGGSIPDTTMDRLKEVLYGAETNPIDMQMRADNTLNEIYEATNELIIVINDQIAEAKRNIPTIQSIEKIQSLLKIKLELTDELKKLIP